MLSYLPPKPHRNATFGASDYSACLLSSTMGTDQRKGLLSRYGQRDGAAHDMPEVDGNRSSSREETLSGWTTIDLCRSIADSLQLQQTTSRRARREGAVKKWAAGAARHTPGLRQSGAEQPPRRDVRRGWPGGPAIQGELSGRKG
ncbi:hypothetical protein BX600DRAFT_537235 [Xylariales sp. PMI_506]|nr:hypothetical protein BX600DRAFT_537235 [Xylariales sp. PMI_506]